MPKKTAGWWLIVGLGVTEGYEGGSDGNSMTPGASGELHSGESIAAVAGVTLGMNGGSMMDESTKSSKAVAVLR